MNEQISVLDIYDGEDIDELKGQAKELYERLLGIVHCKDCKHFINHDKRCGYFNHGIRINDYCSYGERKIVHCKECEHFQPFSDEDDKEYDGMCEDTYYDVNETDYCSYGEQRENQDG